MQSLRQKAQETTKPRNFYDPSAPSAVKYPFIGEFSRNVDISLGVFCHTSEGDRVKIPQYHLESETLLPEHRCSWEFGNVALSAWPPNSAKSRENPCESKEGLWGKQEFQEFAQWRVS